MQENRDIQNSITIEFGWMRRSSEVIKKKKER